MMGVIAKLREYDPGMDRDGLEGHNLPECLLSSIIFSGPNT